MQEMPSNKPRAGGTVPRSKSEQQPSVPLMAKKKRVAVDQYMARTLLQEIPRRVPLSREVVSQPAALPALVRKIDKNWLYCEMCQMECSSFKILNQHRAGRVHRKHVLVRAIKLNRSRLSAFTIHTGELHVDGTDRDPMESTGFPR